jgi:hypothetical protein
MLLSMELAAVLSWTEGDRSARTQALKRATTAGGQGCGLVSRSPVAHTARQRLGSPSVSWSLGASPSSTRGLPLEDVTDASALRSSAR